ncbi:MAG: phenylacetate--CoA ligase family protein [Bacillota bacterium]
MIQNKIKYNLNGLYSKFFRNGKIFKDSLLDLEKSQWYSYDQLIALQNQKLRNIVHYAYENVPFYQKKYNELGVHPTDIKTTEDLYKLPLITKQEVKQNLNSLLSKKVNKRLLRMGHTSGTTGSPAHFYRDLYSINFENAMIWRQWNWAGYLPGDKRITIRGDYIIPRENNKPPFWLNNFSENQLLMSSFHLSDTNLNNYYNKINEFNPKVIQAYPSTVFILAKWLQKNKLEYPLKAIFTSSEPLYDAHRNLIEDVFNCKIWDLYGMAERVISAQECEVHNGLHLNEEYGITEILDLATGKTALKGFLVGTSLVNHAMPLIRYVTDDIGEFFQEECTCNRKSKRLKPIETMKEDLIITPDGKYISPQILTHCFKPLDNVLKSQIIQEDINNVTVKLVKEKGYSESETKILLQGLSERFGKGINIKIEFVSDIPRTKAGKYRWVISNLSRN